VDWLFFWLVQGRIFAPHSRRLLVSSASTNR
jgi:hypothetical protein